jgi:chromosome segregation ATPase
MRTRVLTLVVCGVVILAGAARGEDPELKKLREEVARMRDRATAAEVEAKLLQNRNKQLEERIRELEKEVERLRKKDGAPPAGGTRRPRRSRGWSGRWTARAAW